MKLVSLPLNIELIHICCHLSYWLCVGCFCSAQVVKLIRNFFFHFLLSVFKQFFLLDNPSSTALFYIFFLVSDQVCLAGPLRVCCHCCFLILFCFILRQGGSVSCNTAEIRSNKFVLQPGFDSPTSQSHLLVIPSCIQRANPLLFLLHTAPGGIRIRTA